MKSFFNEFRTIGLTFFALTFMLLFGACREFPETSVTPWTDSTPYASQTGIFEIEDDCYSGSYIITIEDTPDQQLIITNLRNFPELRLEARITGDGFIIPSQTLIEDGLVSYISGIATRTGQKLDLSYRISYESTTKVFHCQVRGFEL